MSSWIETHFFKYVSYLPRQVTTVNPTVIGLVYFYTTDLFIFAFYLFLVFMYLTESQKRLEQKPGVVTATPTGAPTTPATASKVIVGSLSGQGTPTTKVVLSTKMGTPVTFQQNKNFQQSFATWVKQGQSAQGLLFCCHCLLQYIVLIFLVKMKRRMRTNCSTHVHKQLWSIHAKFILHQFTLKVDSWYLVYLSSRYRDHCSNI